MISFADTIQFNDAIHCTQMIYIITYTILLRRIQTTIRPLYCNNSNIFICLLRQTHTIHTGNYINMINDMYFPPSLAPLAATAAPVHFLCIGNSYSDVRAEGVDCVW